VVDAGISDELIEELVVSSFVVEGMLELSPTSEGSEDPLSPLDNVVRLVSNHECCSAKHRRCDTAYDPAVGDLEFGRELGQYSSRFQRPLNLRNTIGLTSCEF